MYWSEKDRRFYDSELDYCFGNERTFQKIKYKTEYDDLLDVKEPVKKQNKMNSASDFDAIFE